MARWSPEKRRDETRTGWTYERWAHKSSGCVTAILLVYFDYLGDQSGKEDETDVAFITSTFVEGCSCTTSYQLAAPARVLRCDVHLVRGSTLGVR